MSLTVRSLVTRALLPLRLPTQVVWVASTMLLWMSPGRSEAQVIPLKTVPVATGDQFLLLPSQRLGMGGVSIALDDALLDPSIRMRLYFIAHEVSD